MKIKNLNKKVNHFNLVRNNKMNKTKFINRNTNLTNNKKAQIVIYDFMFGFITFLIIITIIMVMWFQTTTRIGQENEQEMKLKIAYDLAGILTQTPGSPERWELNETYFLSENFTIGLATSHNVLSRKKLDSFIQMNEERGYEEIVEMLNMHSYSYQIRIRDKDNRPIETIGRNPGYNISGTVTRRVILDNEIASIEVTIY
jgi:hypothetical protein